MRTPSQLWNMLNRQDSYSIIETSIAVRKGLGRYNLALEDEE